jgi:WD40 repeat protein
MLLDHAKRVTHVEFTNDGKTLVSESLGSTGIKFWETETWQKIGEIQDETYHFALSPDNKTLAGLQALPGFARKDRSFVVKIYAFPQVREIAQLAVDKPFARMRFSPDGSMLAVMTYDNTAWVFDTKTWKKTAVIQHADLNLKGSYSVIDFSADSQSLAAGAYLKNHGGIKLSDPQTGLETRTLDAGSTITPMYWLGFAPRGHVIAAAALGMTPNIPLKYHRQNNNDVFLFDMNSGQLLHRLPQEYPAIVEAAWSPDGQQIAVGLSLRKAHLMNSKGPLTIWDTRTGKKIHTMKGFRRTYHDIRFSPDGQLLFAVASQQNTPTTMRIAPELADWKKYYDRFDKELVLWDVKSGQRDAVLRNSFAVNCAAFGRDSKTTVIGGMMLSAAGHNGAIGVWKRE